jgi:DNA-binding response OmpR family regulator
MLLIEDHADTRSMYLEFLGTDYDVRDVGDGVAALAALDGFTPDVIVTDLALPRMDGFEFIAKIREDTRFTGVPIVALSGYTGADRDPRVRVIDPGVVLQKPCLPDTLLEQIEALLRGKTGGRT